MAEEDLANKQSLLETLVAEAEQLEAQLAGQQKAKVEARPVEPAEKVPEKPPAPAVPPPAPAPARGAPAVAPPAPARRAPVGQPGWLATVRSLFRARAARRQLEGVRRQIAQIRDQIEKLEQTLASSPAEAASPVDRYVQRLRVSMAEEDLASKRPRLEGMTAEAAKLEAELAELPATKASEQPSAASAALAALARSIDAIDASQQTVKNRFSSAARAAFARRRADAVEQIVERRLRSAAPAAPARGIPPSGRRRGRAGMLIGAGVVGGILLLGILAIAIPGRLGVKPEALVTVELASSISETVSEEGETFFSRVIEFDYSEGQVVLSGAPPPVGDFSVDDGMTITVTRPDGSTSIWDRAFNAGCEESTWVPAEDVTELFSPGRNIVSVSLYHVCGSTMGTPGPIFLSNLRPQETALNTGEHR